MPGRDEEPPLIGRSLLAAFLGLVLAAPARASAQDGSDIRALVEAGLGGTRIHGETTALAAFGAGLALSPSFAVGGAGYMLPSSVRIGQVALQDLELTFGYGGIFAEYRSPPVGSGTWFGRLLLAAGNSDINDVPTSLRLDSDNFLVLEPTVGFHRPLPYRLGALFGLSYRFVGGVDDLRGVEASDLRSLSFTLRIRLSPL